MIVEIMRTIPMAIPAEQESFSPQLAELSILKIVEIMVVIATVAVDMSGKLVDVVWVAIPTVAVLSDPCSNREQSFVPFVRYAMNDVFIDKFCAQSG